MTNLQELEDVGEDADRECEVHGPGAHVEKATQQLERTQAVHLTQQHLRMHKRIQVMAYHEGTYLWQYGIWRYSRI